MEFKQLKDADGKDKKFYRENRLIIVPICIEKNERQRNTYVNIMNIMA